MPIFFIGGPVVSPGSVRSTMNGWIAPSWSPPWTRA